MFVTISLMEVVSDPSIQSFYSSVMKEVIHGVCEDEGAIDPSIASLLKESWLSEYFKVTGVLLDLDMNMEPNSEEEALPTQDTVI